MRVRVVAHSSIVLAAKKKNFFSITISILDGNVFHYRYPLGREGGGGGGGGGGGACQISCEE